MKITNLLQFKKFRIFSAITLLSVNAEAQTNIGGVVNIYTPVTNVVNCTCPTLNCNQITVGSATGFAIGNKVLIIQMKGARVDSSNTSAHGSILNLYDAGNYEFATISGIAGSVITTTYPLRETYFTNANPKDSAYVQLIKVAVYSGDVNVTSTLKPQAWSAATGTGGVLAIEVSGILTLQANITADTLGFRGSRYQQWAVSCGYDTAFYYQSTIANHSSCTGCGYAYAETRVSTIAAFGGCSAPCTTNRMNTQDPRMAGFRGEGISANTFKKTFASGSIPVAYFEKGKGRWANGGGGGSNHNGGGGGGGNYGVGGWGGKMYNVISGGCGTATFDARRGYGGAGLTPTGSKVYMGGGGGEGHNNGGQGSAGTAGGGIIFITAGSMVNSGAYTISSNGKDNPILAVGDGSGGGGAGGTILMDIPGGYTNPTTVSAKGGKGGDQSGSSCHGTGGGGGGGVIWLSDSALPDDITTVTSAGQPGLNTSPSFDCGSQAWGATVGGSGVVLLGLYSGATTFLNTGACVSPLPVQLVTFTGTVIKDKVELYWTTASETNNKYFIVEKSTDGRSYKELETIEGAGNSTVSLKYRTIDFHPQEGTSYYRLKQVDYNGAVSYSKIVDVNVQSKYEIKVIPNPVTSNKLKLILPEIPSSSCSIHISDRTGKTVYDKSLSPQFFDTTVNLSDIQFRTTGLYYLNVEIDGNIYREKISVVSK